jgi:hypothetical protein
MFGVNNVFIRPYSYGLPALHNPGRSLQTSVKPYNIGDRSTVSHRAIACGVISNSINSIFYTCNPYLHMITSLHTRPAIKSSKTSDSKSGIEDGCRSDCGIPLAARLRFVNVHALRTSGVGWSS